MSAIPPSTLEGTESPNPFEVLWHRYRSLILTVVGALLLALIGKTVLTMMERKELDEKWATFSVSIGLSDTYIDPRKVYASLSEELEEVELEELVAALGDADSNQKPYFQLAIARKSVMESDWDRAEMALAALESGYPKHPLVLADSQAVQTRDQKKLDKDEPKPTEPQWEDPAEGSVVSLMRKQMAAAKGFKLPASFAKPDIPEDASKVKFTMGDYGSFTIALMPSAPLHKDAFLKLAQQEDAFWKDIAVDEIHRSTENFDKPYALHFGFASTKDEDTSKWVTTEPSENIVEFEKTGLSHFAGAVAARPAAEGKSCADRIWISVDDEANLDGNRVVFGFVIDGLDVLREVCEAGMTAQDEEAGSGRPIENIRVTAVEVL